MLNFILDHLLIIIIACVIIFIILAFIFKLFSTALTIIIVVAILGALGIFGPNFIDNMKEPIAATKTFTETTIKPVIEKEIKDANFDYDSNTKKYVIQSSSFKLEGISDSNKADIIFKDKEYTIDVTFLKGFIENKIDETNQNK